MPEAIARQIEKQICLGRLRPDEKLPSENQLMKEFGAARNTVREALRILQALGLITIKRGSRGGPTVTRMSNEFVSDFLIKALSLGGVSGEAFHTFRVAIEPSIAEIVAEKETIDPGIMSQLERKISEARTLYESGEATLLTNMDFHVLLADATENVIFIVISRTLRAGLMAVRPPTQELFHAETIDYHEKILQAIKEHNPARARALMHDHLIEIGQVVRPDDLLNGYM
jgi:GntR family transcriptional repressor for pyruvate dehydrogenase complex